MRLFVEVSPEMTLLLGEGPLEDIPLPPAPVALAFDLDAATPSLAIDAGPTRTSLAEDARLILVIERAALLRVGGQPPEQADALHLPSSLRGIGLAVRDCTLSGETQKVYRLGKSIELLCETIRAMAAGELVPLAGGGALSLADTQRLVAARRLIDERWNEKLTLDRIARACGLNRAKLTRGFREMFGCTIAQALAERRLKRASVMLRNTDLPVSSIGYENGYLNNASFARAFGRRFGMSPTDFRACEAAV